MNKHSELTFQLMVEGSTNAMVLVNQMGKIAYINNYAEKLFMYSKSEIVGQDVSVLIPIKFNTNHPELMKQYFKNPIKKLNRELFAKKKNGTEFSVEIGLSPVVSTDGTLVLASITDISERIKITEEKRRVAEQFRLVVESAPNAIILVGEDGRISLVNKQTEVLFKYNREELIGESMEKLLPDRFRKNHPELRKAFFEKPQTRPMGMGRDLFAIRKDGSEFPIEIGLNPIKMAEGNSVLTSIIDITERKKTEEIQKLHLRQIEDKNEELEQFAYIVSHDLRAPLQSISSFTQLLIDEHTEKLDEEGKKGLNFIIEAASRMNELINGLLDYGRIGKRAEIKKVDFNQVVKNVCEDLSFIIKDSGADLTIAQLPVLKAYETEIRLLFQNLIANAIKFRKPKVEPKIQISAEKQGNFWKFFVTDNGIGIDPDEADKIFNIFQRLHRKEEYEGSGIGLAHCRKIAELHNGEIGVKSEKGKGSEFYFTINTILELE